MLLSPGAFPSRLHFDSKMQTFPTQYSLRHLLEQAQATPRAFVLALVVATRGSSYRKAGALALIEADGLICGCISGGCLEEQMIEAAQSTLADGAARLLTLDTRTDEDRWFGSQSGCRGEVDLLLLPSSADGRHPLLEELQRANAQHQALDLCVRTRATPPSYRSASGALADDEIAVQIPPVPRVLLLGGGPEAPALIALSRTLGWWLEVVEHRARYLAQARLTEADRVHCARPAEQLKTMNLAIFDAVICATHLYDEDALCLKQLAETDVAFVGVLGPRVRAQELLAELGPDVSAALAPRLHAPVGIALGAYGPESVALSIAARLAELFARA